MVSLTLSIDEETRALMDKFPDADWSNIAYTPIALSNMLSHIYNLESETKS